MCACEKHELPTVVAVVVHTGCLKSRFTYTVKYMTVIIFTSIWFVEGNIWQQCSYIIYFSTC